VVTTLSTWGVKEPEPLRVPPPPVRSIGDGARSPSKAIRRRLLCLLTKEVGSGVHTWQAIDSIRVVRDFADRPVPVEDVDRIVNAGRRAGSSKNLQRWDFVVVRDRHRLQELSRAGPFAGPVAHAAVAVALVTPDPSQPDQPLSVIWDLGRAAQNMVLAAWERGIGSVPATVYEHDLVDKLLGLPADRHCEFILSFGYPADETLLSAPKKAGGRASLTEVLHEEAW
jgi:nitroreductase